MSEATMKFDPSTFNENDYGQPSAGKKVFEIFAVESAGGTGNTGKEWSAFKVYAMICRDAVQDSDDLGKSANAMLFIGGKPVELFKLLIATGLKKEIEYTALDKVEKHLVGQRFVGFIKHRTSKKDDGTDVTFAGIDCDRGCKFDPYVADPDPAWAPLIAKAKEDHAEWLKTRAEQANTKTESATPEGAKGGGGFDNVPF